MIALRFKTEGSWKLDKLMIRKDVQVDKVVG